MQCIINDSPLKLTDFIDHKKQGQDIFDNIQIALKIIDKRLKVIEHNQALIIKEIQDNKDDGK